MENRPITGLRDELERRPRRARGEFPAPDDWVVAAMYPDQIVWERYPVTGSDHHYVSDYVFRSTGHSYPPYEERETTVVLEREWDDSIPSWRDSPTYELSKGQEHILTLDDQPLNEQELGEWWGVVIEALTLLSNNETCRTVQKQIDSPFLSTS